MTLGFPYSSFKTMTKMFITKIVKKHTNANNIKFSNNY